MIYHAKFVIFVQLIFELKEINNFQDLYKKITSLQKNSYELEKGEIFK